MKNRISRTKLLWIARSYRAYCPPSLQTIAETTFADRHKTTKVFSLESFPLYSMHCHCNIGLQLTYTVYNSILPLLTITFRCIHVLTVHVHVHKLYLYHSWSYVSVCEVSVDEAWVDRETDPTPSLHRQHIARE